MPKRDEGVKKNEFEEAAEVAAMSGKDGKKETKVVKMSPLQESAKKFLKDAKFDGDLQEMVEREVKTGDEKHQVVFMTFGGGKETVKELLWFIYADEAGVKNWSGYSIEVDNTPEDTPIVYFYKD